ncbi:hypothetical protein L210DRAFT_3523478 [Boletus edulis BED1]|uniref:Uncharacterized protein n=1 Tax=Boletus edulis BED1 TaxID=1328754 RepID=A0AAD4GJI1_BOLED|nr:hypothetical protein L210DRAFT_3523478 [Boletus edulis BED1]
MSDRASSSPPAPVPTLQQNHETPVQVKGGISRRRLHHVVPKSEAPSSSPSRSVRRTTAQRRAFLRDEPLAGEVEPHRVYCLECEKWIKLSLHTEYAISNWTSHKQRCPASSTTARPVRCTPSKPNFSPGSRVATTERQIVLLNDPQVKRFSTRQVHCRSCKTVVALEGEVTCIPRIPAPITPEGPSPRVFPPTSTSSTHSQARSARSPTPAGEDSQSTETTVVAESSPAAGVKRGRDEETEEEAARPTNRPRTETHKPPESVLGWLVQPLKEFTRGFREGLGST